MERTRYGLSEAIVNVLESWPELERRVFTQSHYRGDSVEVISLSVGLSVSEVRSILEQCNRRLRQSLMAFWRSSVDSPRPAAKRNPELAGCDCLL